MDEIQAKRADKIAKLLAKAEGTTNDNEAEAFFAQAAALQSKWAIDDAMIAHARGQRIDDKVHEFRLEHSGVYSEALQMLATEIGHAAGFRILVSRGAKTVRFTYWVGFSRDTSDLEMLYTSLMIQQARATSRYMKMWRANNPGHKNFERFRAQRSFMKGFAVGAADALRKAKAEAVHEAAEEHGTGVGLVLASKKDQVDRWYEDQYAGRTRKARGSSSTDDWGAVGAGHAEGGRADLGQRAGVQGGGTRELG
jgi:hypothetical protein